MAMSHILQMSQNLMVWWATGHTVEDARRNFIEALEEWIAARLQWGLLIPPIGGQTIEVSKEPVPVV